MILSGLKIQENLGKNIIIEPYDEKFLNPNSYNLRLFDELLCYDEEILDMKKNHKTKVVKIPPEGLLLEPSRLYLGRTLEYTETLNYVPMLEGRSSVGRLGLFIHVTAGFGDVGFKGFWTLEIHCIQPIKIYAGVSLCQIYYHTLDGDFLPYSQSGKYQNNSEIQASRLYMDFAE
ncbi:MAG: dCTP deaminase [Firmicutes bacterium]|nr:dCTP deaminase [Bacillota bacterium]